MAGPYKVETSATACAAASRSSCEPTFIRNLRMKVGSQLDRLAACAAHRTCFHLVWASHEIDPAGRRRETQNLHDIPHPTRIPRQGGPRQYRVDHWEVQCSCGNLQVFPLCMDTSRSNQAEKCRHHCLRVRSCPVSAGDQAKYRALKIRRASESRYGAVQLVARDPPGTHPAGGRRWSKRCGINTRVHCFETSAQHQSQFFRCTCCNDTTPLDSTGNGINPHRNIIGNLRRACLCGECAV